MAKIEIVPQSEIMRSPEDGVMGERQVEAVLLGYYARTLKTRDRRGGMAAIGELPAGAVELADDGSVKSIAGEIIRASAPINRATGLPESAGALLPNHRATLGWELALSMIIPPEDFIAACIYTDDLPQNAGKTEDEKEWVALSYKPKMKIGPNGRAVAHHTCLRCHEEWEDELSGAGVCIKCNAHGFMTTENMLRVPIVDRRILDGWSDEEVFALKTSARHLKRVVHRLAEQGYFTTKPRIDESAEGELGTDELMHGEDDMTMGFQITPKGLHYAEEFAKKHPVLLHGHHILDAMGRTHAELAPEWLKAQKRTGDVQQEFALTPRARTPITPKKTKPPKVKTKQAKPKPKKPAAKRGKK